MKSTKPMFAGKTPAKRMCRRRGGGGTFFKRRLPSGVLGGMLIMFSVFLLSQVAIAGVAGKIVGKVTDKTSGESLPGANIIIVGTTLGAAADQNGEYIILNVPPGSYEVEASMIGYAKVKITGVRVEINRTSEVNFGLSQEAIAGRGGKLSLWRIDLLSKKMFLPPRSASAQRKLRRFRQLAWSMCWDSRPDWNTR